ncbi:MAG TPA: hypothetical protein VI636_20240 [Candidatus Angelobacter sp.]
MPQNARSASWKKPILGDKNESLSCVLTGFGVGIRSAKLGDPVVGCSRDLDTRNGHSLPYVHPLRDSKQKPVDVPKCVVTMTAFAQVTKKNPPLSGKAASLVNPYRITAFD